MLGEAKVRSKKREEYAGDFIVGLLIIYDLIRAIFHSRIYPVFVVVLRAIRHFVCEKCRRKRAKLASESNRNRVRKGEKTWLKRLENSEKVAISGNLVHVCSLIVSKRGRRDFVCKIN